MNVEALTRFADNARLSDEERADADALLRRYVVAHVNTAGCDHEAHAAIGNDYQAMRLRMRAPTLVAYKSSAVDIDAPTFAHYVEHSASSLLDDPAANVALPEFQAFQQAVFPPPPASAEQYAYVTRKDRWRERGAFLALGMRTKPGFYGTLRALGVEQRAASILRHAIRDADQYAREVGQVLASMRYELDAPLLSSASSLDVDVLSDKKKEAPKEAPIASVVVVPDARRPPTESLDALRRDMEPYRVRAMLGPTFDTDKLAKQMILAGGGVLVSREARAVMGPYQSAIVPLASDAERAVALRALDAFGGAPTTTISAESPLCRAVAQAHGRTEWTARELMRHIIAPQQMMDPLRYERYANATATKSEEDAHFIAAVLALR